MGGGKWAGRALIVMAVASLLSGCGAGVAASPPSEISGEHVYRATDESSFATLKGSFLLGGLVTWPEVVPPCPSEAGPPGDGQGLLPYCYWPSIDGLALSPKSNFDEPSNEIVVARVHVNDSLAAECQPAVIAECRAAIVVESVVWTSKPATTASSPPSAPTAMGAGPNAGSSPTTVSGSLPSPSASPTVAGDWKVLAASAGVGASWSADGRWLAVWERLSYGATRDLRLLDSSGNLVRSLDGDRVVWLDATRFVLWRASSSFLGSVDSTVLTPTAVTFPADALSNSHGAVAITTANSSDTAKTSFVVWTQAGTSRVVIGEPEAWSPDGTRIAVWHSTAPAGPLGVGYQPTGWVEVLSWPDLRSVASLKDDSFVRQTSFDPSGRYLVVSRLGVAGFSILDLATGRMVGPSGVAGSPVWDSSSDLLVSAADGSVTTYPISGAPPTTRAGLGDGVASSTDGSTIVTFFSQDYLPNPRPITLIRNGVSRTVSVPGGLESAPVLASHGSGVVIVCLVHHLLPSEETEAMLFVG
jgi:hypothetical protein